MNLEFQIKLVFFSKNNHNSINSISFRSKGSILADLARVDKKIEIY